jgi:predicted phosphodiesterase
MDKIDKDIARLASMRDRTTGNWLYGRRAIMRLVPGVTEWRVRNLIREVRGEGNGASSAPSPTQKAAKEKETSMLSLPRIIVKVPQRKKVRTKSTKKGIEDWFILSDFHAGWEHKRSCDVVYQIIEEEQPSKVVVLGDLVNLDLFSKYDHIPSNPNIWVDDVVAAGAILGNLKVAAPAAELLWLSGNHEERLQKHLIRKDPLLYEYLDLKKLFLITDNEKALQNWKFIDQMEYFQEDLNLVLAHGHKVRKHSGMTGMAHADDLWLSVVVGHSHRLGLYFKSSGRSRYMNEPPVFALENGCLCRTDIPYIGGKTSNWQRGFSVLTIDRSEETPRVDPTIVPIHEGKAIFRGKVYKA